MNLNRSLVSVRAFMGLLRLQCLRFAEQKKENHLYSFALQLHLELEVDLFTEAFLRVLHGFIARGGRCLQILIFAIVVHNLYQL